MNLRRRLNISLSSRRNLWGYLFISPFIIGFVLFILYPFAQSVLFSVTELSLKPYGYEMEYIGFENYRYALFVHAGFLPNLTSTVTSMLSNVIWILVFSFFAASILNQKFKGRMLARVIFFLPVVLASGMLLELEQVDYMLGVLEEGHEAAGGFLATEAIRMFLLEMRLPDAFLEFITEAIDHIPDIINASGIQILIFLAGYQSIPPSLYEAADVEGATSWENFWMITLPLLSPLILTNIVYTIVAFFTAPTNETAQMIRSTTFEGPGYGVSTAMSWIYFLIVAIFLGVTIKICSRFVFYHE